MTHHQGGWGGGLPAAAQSDWVSVLIADFYYAVDHKNLCQCAHYSSKKKITKMSHHATDERDFPN